MTALANRRSLMTLFSAQDCAHCHRVRIVLAEKDIVVDIVDIDTDNKPADLLDLNPYNTVPTLVDRSLVIYEPRIMKEYLDERFPHPPLMPVDPVARARTRLALYRIERDWYTLVDDIEAATKTAVKSRKILRDAIVSSSEVFAAKPYFLSDDFSLADCSVAPLLWRLEHYGIELPDSAKPIKDYMKRVFNRPSFIDSLTETESDMRM